jgi:hypothetical protein
MYYLRAVRNRSYFTPAAFNLAEAINSLTDHLAGRASVYEVTDEGDADRVAVLFAMLIKPGPENLDYVLIPDTWITELDCGQAALVGPDQCLAVHFAPGSRAAHSVTASSHRNSLMSQIF